MPGTWDRDQIFIFSYCIYSLGSIYQDYFHFEVFQGVLVWVGFLLLLLLFSGIFKTTSAF